MADPEPSKKNSTISLRKLTPRNLLLIIVFTAFFWISESSSASANTTTLSGKFTGLPNEDVYGYAWVEKKVSGSWIEIESSYTKDIYKEGDYSLDISEAVGTTIRVWSYFQGTTASYLSVSTEFDLTAGTQVRNFAVSSINIQLDLSNSLACNRTWAVASSTNLSESRFSEGIWAPIVSGTVKFAVPSGLNFTISGTCNGNISFESSVTSTSSLQTIAVTISTPNVTGKITGITDSTNFYGYVQKKNVEDASNTWQNSKYSFYPNNEGNYALGLPLGTYRLVVRQIDKSGGELDYVKTFSEEFTVGDSNITLNFSMSTFSNVTYTFTPTSISAGGWINVERKVSCSIDDSCFDWYDEGSQIRSDGTAKMFLEEGTYRVTVYPGDESQGHVSTTGEEFTVTSTTTSINLSMDIKIGNLKFVVTPIESAKYGWVRIDIAGGKALGKQYYYGNLNENGVAFLNVPAGTYRAIIEPGTRSDTAKTTIISSLVVTGSSQTVNVTLSAGNVSGIVSPANTTRGGSVYAEEKIGTSKSYWSWTSFSAVIQDDGSFSMSLPQGTFRLKAEPSQDGAFIRTSSEEFVVGESPVTVNFTLRTANVSGTVSPSEKAVGGYVYATPLKNYDSNYEYYAYIKSDGSYQLALPAGTYSLRATPNAKFRNYFGLSVEDVVVTNTPQTKNLTLVAANISGSILPTNKSRYGWGFFEKLVSGYWQGFESGSINIDTQGNYYSYLTPGTYRARIFPPGDATGVYSLTSDSFEMGAESQVRNFTLPSTNISIPILPLVDSPGTFVTIMKIQSENNLQYYGDGTVNMDGNFQAYLPEGKYKLILNPRGSRFARTESIIFDSPAGVSSGSTVSPPTSITLATPNIKGTITPLNEAAYSWVCVEKFKEEVFSTEECVQADSNGRFGFKVVNGKYRVVATPRSINEKFGVGATQYTITTSSEVTVADDVKTVNFEFSTGNLIGTVNGADVTKSVGGWIYALQSDGQYSKWTNYRSQISIAGKYALQVPAGTYRLYIQPPEEATGVVRTESADVVVGGSTVTFNVNLDTPNVSGTVSPTDKSAGGWVHAEQYYCQCGKGYWSHAQGVAASGPIRQDGKYELKIDSGLSRVIAYPNYEATGVTRTVSNTFTAGNTLSTMNITLSEGNVQGTISSTANAAGGYIRVEQKVGEYWQWTNYSTHILENGTYRLQVENGTYRLIVTPGWRATEVVETPSAEFTVADNTQTVNVTLLAPNLRGTVTNLSAAISNNDVSAEYRKYQVAASAYVLQKVESSYRWINKYVQIYSDGSYSTYLPNGTYQLVVYHMQPYVSGLTRVTTSDIVVSGGSNTFDFEFTSSNLVGTISPTSASTWGSVCAQRQNGAGWDYVDCTNIKSNGRYDFNVSAGTYRIEARPSWSSTGYAKVISETATVGASGITTLNATLTSANVKLKILDTTGRANYQGSITVRNSAGEYVDIGKSWIPELGRVDFYLAEGTYSVEIQPGGNRSGVRTTTSIVVPGTGVLEQTLSLVSGNVQGTVRTAAGAGRPCVFVTATATGKTTVKTTAKNDGTFTLNLESGVAWTISVIDPDTGNTATATITPGGTSTNPVTVTIT
jgi:hypothetical protein